MSLFFVVAPLYGQGLGDHFSEKKAYFEAVTEYERLLFFNRYASEDQLLYKLAEAYYKGGQRDLAEESLLRAITNGEASPYDRDSLILLARLYWDAYRYEPMRTTLDYLATAVTESQVQKLQYIKAWTYLYQARWERAIELLQTCQLSGAKTLIVDIKNVSQVPQKSVGLAVFLATLLPGAGQLYAGDFRNALNASVLVNSIRLSILWDLYDGAYFIGMIKYFFLHTRYSKGSVSNLRRFVARRNVNAYGDYLKEVSERYPKPLELLERMGTTEG